MAEPDSGSERFLEDIDRQLPFEVGEREDILEELRAHLADSAAALAAGGVDRAEAERKAVERLGSAKSLAKELTRARRDRSRLLAAAGAGAWGVLRGGLWGGIVGWAVMSVALLLVTTVAAVAARQIGSSWGGLDSGTGAVPNTLALGIAVFVAARLLTPTFASRAGFTARLVRWVTMPLGAALWLVYAVAVWTGPLNWPGVAALLALPLWWVAGAWQTRPFRLGFPRRIVVVLAAAIVVTFVVGTVAGPITSGSSMGAVGNPAGWDRIGAPMPDWALKVDSGGTDWGGSFVERSIIVPDRGLLSGWTDLRIEAWRAGPTPSSVTSASGSNDASIQADSGPLSSVDPAETEPFLTAPLQWSAPGVSPDGSSSWYGSEPWPANAVTLSGDLRLDRTPGVNWAWLALTGVDPSGQRHLLTFPTGRRIFFNGSVLDWFEAVLAGR
ncbi:MAG TPA: permease prefix domain 1-containing protein [Candidatus Limnocylindrales bacterium]